MAEQITRNQASVQAIQDALEANEIGRLRELLGNLHPSEIADLLESLPTAVRDELWVHIDSTIEGDVLSNSNAAVRNSLIENMDPAQVANATSTLASDDAADILQDLPDDLADEILLSMDEQESPARRHRTDLSSRYRWRSDERRYGHRALGCRC